MGEPRAGAPLDDGSGWTGSEEGSEEGTGGSEGAGGDGGPDAEGVWSPDIEQSFQEALAIYPPCGRRKIILSDEGKMYGRNELIARYIKLRTGKTRTRKQVSSHIQVLARRKSREIQSKLKALNVDQVSKDKAFQTMATMSSAQLISAPSLQAKLGPAGPQTPELFQFWSGSSGPPWNVPDVKPFSQTPFSLSLTPPSTDLPGYEPPQALSPPALPPPAPSPPAWQARALGTARLQLVEFSAFVEPPDATDSYQRHLFVHISQHCPSPGAPPLESVDVRQIYDKFPEKKGGLRELYDRGPPHAFFLVKFWADLNWGPSGEEVGAGGSSGGFYGVSSQYESLEHMTLTCSSKVCSFGKQVVEKVETERAQLEDGRFVYRLLRSPMCEYLVNFLHKLRQLPERYMMNSVLENFTILQVVTNRDTQELLLCTAYVFEVSTKHLKSQQQVRVVEAQRTERKVALDMRSTHKIKSSLAKVGAAPESLPEITTDAQASGTSLAKVSSAESSPGSHALEDKGTATWSLTAWVSEVQAFEARAVRAQAWETQAFEAQSRASHPKATPVTEAEAAPVLKQRLLAEKVQVPEKEKSEVLITRPFWSNKAEYLLAQMGYTMRPASLWSFCYLWLHSGGGIFLIIYIFLLFLIGIPLLFLEMAAGQRMRQGNIGVWKVISPWIGGVGYTSFMVCFINGLFLNVVTAWILFYLSQSFQYPVPWEKCPLLENASGFDPECARTTPTLYFWYRMTLKASDSIEDDGPPVFSLCLPLFLSVCLLGVFMLNGLKWTGKVMCVLVSSSGLIMLCFVVRSIMLEGAVFGLHYMTIVKISAIYNVNVWRGAGNQVLCSLGLGFGSIISIASHIQSSSSCLNDAVIVALANLISMMLVTPFIFSVLGFWATQLTHRCNEKNTETLLNLVNMGILPPEAQPPQNLIGNPTSIFTSWFNSLSNPIKKEVLSHVPECNLEEQFLKIKESTNFAFLAFVEAMSFIPGSVFWSFLFFLMLLNLEMSTMIGIMDSIITSLQDIFISVQKYTKLFTVVVLMIMFLCGLFFTRPSGSYYIRLLTDYWTILPIIIVIIFENLAVKWAREASSFFADMANLWGHPMYSIIRWLWSYLIPVVLLALSVTTVFQLSLKNITYLAWDSSTSKEIVRQYPSWGLFTLFALLLIVILPIPIYFVYCFTHGIPFNSTSWDKPVISSKSLPLSFQLTPIKEVENEEILQGDIEIADQPVV